MEVYCKNLHVHFISSNCTFVPQPSSHWGWGQDFTRIAAHVLHTSMKASANCKCTLSKRFNRYFFCGIHGNAAPGFPSHCSSAENVKKIILKFFLLCNLGKGGTYKVMVPTWARKPNLALISIIWFQMFDFSRTSRHKFKKVNLQVCGNLVHVHSATTGSK